MKSRVLYLMQNRLHFSEKTILGNNSSRSEKAKSACEKRILFNFYSTLISVDEVTPSGETML